MTVTAASGWSCTMQLELMHQLHAHHSQQQCLPVLASKRHTAVVPVRLHEQLYSLRTHVRTVQRNNCHTVRLALYGAGGLQQ
jgi:hypothetical protein